MHVHLPFCICMCVYMYMYAINQINQSIKHTCTSVYVICNKNHYRVTSTVSIMHMYMNALCMSCTHSGHLVVITVGANTSLLLGRSESIVDSKFLWTP